MDRQEVFLQSRKIRALGAHQESKLKAPKQSEMMGAFWSELRIRLDDWNYKLQDLEEDQASQKSICHLLDDLKEELCILRKHCLSSTTGISFIENWNVPVVLPNADLRLLHAEFTKCTTKWEAQREKLMPKGKFIFRRYRQELAKRRSLGIPLDAPSHQVALLGEESLCSGEVEASLLDLEDCDITIRKDGSVSLLGSASRSNISTSSLLLKNLKNCSVRIEKQLQALHMLQISKTEVHVVQPISSSIHITGCSECEVHCSSQQLRIHQSCDLVLQVEMLAGAILEDSSRLLFRGSNLDVKDFNWLRAGVPSPNFRIEASTVQDIHSILSSEVTTEALPTPQIRSHCDKTMSEISSVGKVDSSVKARDSINENDACSSDEDEL